MINRISPQNTSKSLVHAYATACPGTTLQTGIDLNSISSNKNNLWPGIP